MKIDKILHCVDIDECQEHSDNCTSFEHCINKRGSFMCTCKFGFRRDNISEACVDRNECLLGKDTCSKLERCENTVGSYRCVKFLGCGTGYTLNAETKNCEDIDECILGTHDCKAGYSCRNTEGSYRCEPNSSVISYPQVSPVVSKIVLTTSISPAVISHLEKCPHGFEVGENGQCRDVDECQRSSNPCPRPSEKCYNTEGSYRYFFFIFYGFILRIKCIKC